MLHRYSPFARYFIAMGVLCTQAYRMHGDELHAKGFNVLELSFPAQGEVWDVSIQFSLDGETFRSVAAGLPRPWRLFRSVQYRDEQTVILVPVIGSFGMGQSEFVFAEPGKYDLRWRITFRDQSKPRTVPDQLDKDIESVVVEQVVEVAPPRAADLAFLERLSDPDFLRHLFRDDFFDRQTDAVRERMLAPEGKDFRALKVIAQLLKATRAKYPQDVPRRGNSREETLRWGEALYELAKEFPESSYAPYAAYYAACCYYVSFWVNVGPSLKGLPDDEKLPVVASRAANAPDYAKASEAMALAAEHGDAYLKPLAVFHRAVLQMSSGDLDEVDRLLQQADELSGGEGTIRTLTEKLRERMRTFKRSQKPGDRTTQAP